ncbi:uncharacterized protein LOC143452421 [Clavelina lepadiformis]|uniref:uncharacterized protein LOC143452421 n=1 Tax=Clavelina lepadiformis TaxID=159417 RepID=UPI004041621B
MMSRFRKFFRLLNRSVDANKPNNGSAVETVTEAIPENKPADGTSDDDGRSQGLEIMNEKISSINDLISNQKIDEALMGCESLISTIKSTSSTAKDAFDVGNDIINLMSTLRREKYSPTILTLLLLAGDLHKQIDDPTEKVKLMERCADECYNFVVRYNKNLQRTTYRHVISRMTDFVQSIQSVKVNDGKLVATSKAQCWKAIALCLNYLAEYSRAIEVLQPVITTLESTFGDGCRKMWLYSLCCNNIAEAFYIKSFHAHQEVEDRNEQRKMETIHRTINSQCKDHVGESVETSEEITFAEEVSKDDFAHPMEFLEHKPSDSSTSKHKCYKRLKKLPETFTAYFFLCEKHDGVKIVEKYVDRKFAHIAENEKENFKKISDQHFYHPNVVQYYDTVTQGEYTSLYMELCHGDLAKWVDNKLPECKLTSFEICQQATEGIYHLHMKCNMIHRDVKPSNFLVRVDDDGATVKVSDFGLSKALPKDASKVPTASTSTASYMAPEHHLGKDERIKTPWRKCSDIFSLGITFYHILTSGGHPFGATHAEQVYKIQDKKSPVLDFRECSAFTSKLQEELATDLIKKMLHFNPEQRPKIEEVKQCLAKIVQHASTNVSHSEPMLHSSIYGDILRCQKHDGTVIIKKVFNKKFAHIAENEKENFKKISTKSFYHKNVVKYYDTLVIDDRTCILMEECHGNVEQWAEGKLPECRLTPVEVCKQATEGICHLHRKCNMIHRDVKPSNFLIRIDDGDKCAAVKVCDFGLTKILPSDKSNAPTTSNSTLSYMASEHHSGKDKKIKTPWRKCSDIFSLGITFYHILTRGGHPFGASHAEQVYKIQDKKSPVLDFRECSAQHFKALPSKEQRELACDLIKKMLDFDPKNRPTIEKVKKHPFFWDSEKIFCFYKDANEHFHQLRKQNQENYQESLQRFAKYDITVDNIPEPLRDSNLEDFPITEKKCRNIHDLLNRIRDMNEHANEKSEPSKLCLGVSEDGSIDYGVFLSSLTGPYPRLLAELYGCLSEEAIMQSFY